jgi:hypothetical protein
MTIPSALGSYAITADFIPEDQVNYNSLIQVAVGNFRIEEVEEFDGSGNG